MTGVVSTGGPAARPAALMRRSGRGRSIVANAVSVTAPASQDRLAELRASAKGWHGVQLAALGFIGLCGVIQTGESTEPRALQVISGVLVLLAFVLACLGIYLVGRAAWPLYRGEHAREEGGEAEIETASRQLTRGLLMTFLSIAALALATAASWWPDEDGGDGAGAQEVQVRTNDNRSACGELAGPAQPGTLRVLADSQPIDVALGSIASVEPVGSC